MKHTADTLKETMKSAPIWHITFTKKNGEVRSMNASRDFEFLRENSGELEYEAPVHAATYNALDRGQVRVWDCDNLGWRSITAASVIDLEALGAPESDA